MQQHPRATSIAVAVAGRDGGRLGATLTDTVRLRALLPGGPVESHGRAAVVARFAGWFAEFDTVELVSAAGEPVVDRLLVHYRLDVRRGPTRWIFQRFPWGKPLSVPNPGAVAGTLRPSPSANPVGEGEDGHLRAELRRSSRQLVYGG